MWNKSQWLHKFCITPGLLCSPSLISFVWWGCSLPVWPMTAQSLLINCMQSFHWVRGANPGPDGLCRIWFRRFLPFLECSQRSLHLLDLNYPLLLWGPHHSFLVPGGHAGGAGVCSTSSSGLPSRFHTGLLTGKALQKRYIKKAGAVMLLLPWMAVLLLDHVFFLPCHYYYYKEGRRHWCSLATPFRAMVLDTTSQANTNC